MNQEEKKNKIKSSAMFGGIIFGGFCAFIVGVVFQFFASLRYITSLGAPEDVMQTAFLKGVVIGGLFGCLVGGYFGALISKAKNRNK